MITVLTEIVFEALLLAFEAISQLSYEYVVEANVIEVDTLHVPGPEHTTPDIN
jgi:hypothetical protein